MGRNEQHSLMPLKRSWCKWKKSKPGPPVIPPHDANIIPCQYIFCQKHNETGHIVHHKARHVVKGFKQQFGVNYVDTFAPTIRSSTLWILLSFTAQKEAAIHQCDIKNAYLNSRLKDNVTLCSELPPKYKDFHKLQPDLKGKPNVGSGLYLSMAQKRVLMTGMPESKSSLQDLATPSLWQMKLSFTKYKMINLLLL